MKSKAILLLAMLSIATSILGMKEDNQLSRVPTLTNLCLSSIIHNYDYMRLKNKLSATSFFETICKVPQEIQKKIEGYIPDGILIIKSDTILKNIAFSPNGRWLGATSNHKIKIWDLENKSDKCLILNIPYCDSIVFSSCGRYIICNSRADIKILDFDNEIVGKCILSLESNRNGDHIMAIALSPSGRYLAATLFSGKIILLDLRISLKEKIIANFSSGQYQSLVFSSDEKYVAFPTTEHNGLHILELDGLSENKISLPPEYIRHVTILALSPCGKYLALGNSTVRGDIIICNWKSSFSEKDSLILRSNNNYIYSLKFSPCGRYLIGNEDNAIIIWDLKIKSNDKCIAILNSDEHIQSLSLSSCGRYLAIICYNKIIVRDLFFLIEKINLNGIYEGNLEDPIIANQTSNKSCFCNIL